MGKKLKNTEGYSDPTACEAMISVHHDNERISNLVNEIRILCERYGFHLENRVVLKDNTTGKVWR